VSKHIVAVFVSDLHLSHRAPIARSVEEDWYGVQARYLAQLENIAGGLPIVCCGDIFDKWNAPPELINMALDCIPKGMWAIPGNHDLPSHDYDQIKRSAYGTLVAAKRIRNMDEPTHIACHNGDTLNRFIIHPFPHGFELAPLLRKRDEKKKKKKARNLPDTDSYFHIAAVHDYIWNKGKTGFPGAPKTALIGGMGERLKGYTAAFFGDNHKGFQAKIQNCRVVNCGGFMRRNIDQKEYKPQVGFLFEDGTVGTQKLDCKTDQFIETDTVLEILNTSLDMAEFIGELGRLGKTGLSFVESVKQFLGDHKIGKRVRDIILKAMD